MPALHIAVMVAVNSTMLPLGTAAPDFRLPDTNGKTVSLADFKGKPVLVAFICNHCPYVKHVRAGLAQLARDYQPRGVGIVGINANDVANYPDDSPARMKEEVKSAGYLFPYLYDESQAVAKTYRAACTPDFFLFDSAHRLAYGASSTTVDRATVCRSAARICARRWMPCWRANRFHPSRSPASAAISNGKPATRRTISDSGGQEPATEERNALRKRK